MAWPLSPRSSNLLATAITGRQAGQQTPPASRTSGMLVSAEGSSSVTTARRRQGLANDCRKCLNLHEPVTVAEGGHIN